MKRKGRRKKTRKRKAKTDRCVTVSTFKRGDDECGLKENF